VLAQPQPARRRPQSLLHFLRRQALRPDQHLAELRPSVSRAAMERVHVIRLAPDQFTAPHAGLHELLNGGDRVLVCSQEIRRQEHEADAITREAHLAVRRTFITPFDRSDIRDLITAMDDAIDQMHQTAKATLLYETREFEPGMRRMGDIIVQSAELTRGAIPLLRSMRQNAGRLNAFSEEITRIEDEAEREILRELPPGRAREHEGCRRALPTR